MRLLRVFDRDFVIVDGTERELLLELYEDDNNEWLWVVTLDGIPWVETSVEEHACVIHELLREHIHEYTERWTVWGKVPKSELEEIERKRQPINKQKESLD